MLVWVTFYAVREVIHVTYKDVLLIIELVYLLERVHERVFFDAIWARAIRRQNRTSAVISFKGKVRLTFWR